MAGNWNSGRRPQPTRLRVLRGNPGKRPLNPKEPQPPPATDEFDTPPSDVALDALASAEWKRVVPILRICGLASQAERSALIALCQQWSRYLEAQTKIRDLGMIVKKPNGGLMTNPYLFVADRALSHCHKLWQELGLTPSGRARLSALTQVEPQQASKWAGLL
jgi:P27 family predicted phage terminase small subunit